MQSTNDRYKMECANGNLGDLWAGCVDQGSERVRCPLDHVPCNELPTTGESFSCWGHCENHGGLKTDCIDDTISNLQIFHSEAKVPI